MKLVLYPSLALLSQTVSFQKSSPSPHIPPLNHLLPFLPSKFSVPAHALISHSSLFLSPPMLYYLFLLVFCLLLPFLSSSLHFFLVPWFPIFSFFSDCPFPVFISCLLLLQFLFHYPSAPVVPIRSLVMHCTFRSNNQCTLLSPNPSAFSSPRKLYSACCLSSFYQVSQRNSVCPIFYLQQSPQYYSLVQTHVIDSPSHLLPSAHIFPSSAHAVSAPSFSAIPGPAIIFCP